jgi:hypothetical protein
MLTINSRFFKSVDRTLVEGIALEGDGQILALVNEDGVLRAKPSVGAGDEIFGGFVISSRLPQTYSTMVEEFKVTESKVALARKPDQSQLLVKVDGTKVTVSPSESAPADAAHVSLNANGEVLFHASHMNKDAFVQYHYELSASEARAITGDYYGGAHNTPANAMGVAAVCVEGQLQTDMFDASADWSGVIHPFMGANGRLSPTGDTQLTNVIVLETPNSSSQYLTIEVGV